MCIVLRQLTRDDFNEVMDLFTTVFIDGYEVKYPDIFSREAKMRQDLDELLKFCIDSGYSYGVFVDDKRLVSFCLAADINSLIDKNFLFLKTFDNEDMGKDPYLKHIREYEDEYGVVSPEIYIFYVGTDEDFRNQHYVSKIVFRIQEEMGRGYLFGVIPDKILSNLFKGHSTCKTWPLINGYSFAATEVNK